LGELKFKRRKGKPLLYVSLWKMHTPMQLERFDFRGMHTQLHFSSQRFTERYTEKERERKRDSEKGWGKIIDIIVEGI
jgi:hypothetical protein